MPLVITLARSVDPQKNFNSIFNLPRGSVLIAILFVFQQAKLDCPKIIAKQKKQYISISSPRGKTNKIKITFKTE